MAKITFVQPDGGRCSIEAAVGITLMEAARQNHVRGIVAQCGGACACATCHVYIEPRWVAKLQPPDEMEQGMLESAWDPHDNSRLSCQVQITPALDGMEVTVPERQN